MKHKPRLSDEEQALRSYLSKTFLRIIRKGMIFEPRLVFSNGQIVAKVPTEIDAYYMQAHRIHKESADETQAEGIATRVGDLIIADIRANPHRYSGGPAAA
jgi:hypothetical protein